MTFSLRTLRAMVVAIVVLDLVGVVALSVHRTTRMTTTVTRLASAPTSSPAVSSPPSVPASAPALPPGSAVPVVVAETSTAAGQRTPPSAPPAPPQSTSPTPPPVLTAASCPIPLPTPARTGGLQSLIDFAPAFGPFSAEAFAAASAYQPVLQLLGPILAEYPQYATQLQPVLGPLVHTLADLLDTGFTVFAPYYTPHRQQVLKTETAIAAALAPYAEKLASSAVGSCLVDVEAALVHDTK